MNHSFSSDALKTERYFDQDVMFDKRKVKVYIRTVSRKSIKIQLPAEISLTELKQVIQIKFHISNENQVIYLKGTCLNYNQFIMLQNNWIIHVINFAEVCLPEISVQIKAVSLTKKSTNPSKVKILSSINVKKLIQDYIISQYAVNVEEILLVESGRILKQSMTLLQQNIQNGTTINLIHSKRDESSRSSFNLVPAFKVKVENTEGYKKSEIESVKSFDTSDWKTINILKNDQNNAYQIQCKKQPLQRDSSQKIFTTREMSKTQRQPHDCTNSKNLSTQIGQRECNCRKQKQTTISKEPKFITAEDRKKLSKQIRQQNLQKMMKIKQKKDENLISSPTNERKTLAKVRSMDELKPMAMTQRKKQAKIVTNPQKHVKC